MTLRRLFLSFAFPDEELVARVAYYLSTQPEIEARFYPYRRGVGEWTMIVTEDVSKCDVFVYFAGRHEGDTQLDEANYHFDNKRTAKRGTLVVCLTEEGQIPEVVRFRAGATDPIRFPGRALDPAEALAEAIARRVTHGWIPPDGIPSSYFFEYEKDIVEVYVKRGLGQDIDPTLLLKGFPSEWPRIRRRAADRVNDPKIQERFGTFRKPSAAVLVDTRVSETDDEQSHKESEVRRTLTFHEAGPREHHRYPLTNQPELNVAIVVSGGIAPGINAVLDGIVKRHEAYHKALDESYELKIWGYREGLHSLVSEVGGRSPRRLSSRDLEGRAELGGSILATSRWDDFAQRSSSGRDEMLTRAVHSLRVRGISILYVIGGDGSMRAAHAISRKAKSHDYELAVVGIPKTTDNDILWVWQSFGFLSAVEKARETLLTMHTEAKSNPRLCVVQLFGSDSGFVAAHAALASGVCDAVLIPEVPYTLDGLFKQHIGRRLRDRFQTSPHALVVMAETAIPLDALRFVDGPECDERIPAPSRVVLSDKERAALEVFVAQDRRVRGQTPDALRTAGLKIVTGGLQAMIKTQLGPSEYWQDFRVFPNEPRHLIRSVHPSTSDVIFAERLGALAVDNAMAGYTDCIVSQWLTEFVLVPLELVILGRKRVPPPGVFWKSVLLSTGQPAVMT